MRVPTFFQVLHGKEAQKRAPRNLGRQRYYAEEVQRAWKEASQGQWLSPLRRWGLREKEACWRDSDVEMLARTESRAHGRAPARAKTENLR
jgi:hypothetical protein